MKLCIAAGTRPEWIKLAPVIKELQRRKANFYILHTGQHYSENLNDVFFKELKLPKPKYNLEVGSSSHGQQTAEIISGAEKVFKKDKPALVIVEGDTNSVLGVALAAVKLGIKVAHVEAGLRSYDRTMPEETNRVLVDHMSDYLFAPTTRAKTNLLAEGILSHKICVTGNTIVDSLMRVKHKLTGKKRNMILVTLHRQENVDNPTRFSQFCRALTLIERRFPKWRILFPIHPRTEEKIRNFKLPSNVTLMPPMGYLEFLSLLKSAKVVLTDSGGVQEEACVLGTPCVTLRDNTERPESVQVDANILAGVDPSTVLEATVYAVEVMGKSKWKNPFGDGKAAKRIVDVLEEKSG